VRGAEHVECEAVSHGAMGEPFEPALPALLRRAGSRGEMRCGAIHERGLGFCVLVGDGSEIDC
jgi:hypothetical protein